MNARTGACCVLIALVGGMCGCSSKFAIPQIRESHVGFRTAISHTRTAWSLTGIADRTGDTFCPKVYVRTIYDNPMDYLETGEGVEVYENIYIRRGERFDFTKAVAGGVTGQSNVRSISIVDADCRSANIADFCTAAVKTDVEVGLLKVVGKIAKAENCNDLSDKSYHVNSLNLTGLDEIPARPALFLTELKKIQISKNAVVSTEMPASVEVVRR